MGAPPKLFTNNYNITRITEDASLSRTHSQNGNEYLKNLLARANTTTPKKKTPKPKKAVKLILYLELQTHITPLIV